MKELRIASAPMIKNILENTEISNSVMRVRKEFEPDQVLVETLRHKIKENEEFISVLKDILLSQQMD